MEAGTPTAERFAGMPRWALGLVPLLIIVGLLGAFAVLGGPGLAERNGIPIEDVAVERTVLKPGTIELTVRNDGPDAVRIAQVMVNDAYASFEGAGDDLGRLQSEKITIHEPWIEGQAYTVGLVTSTGGVVEHAIDVATETPDNDLSFYGLMALLGLYVGVIPVAIGMLWLPWLRRVRPDVIRFVMALTVGLLAFLAIDATLEGVELAGTGSQAFGGASLVFLGAIASYLALTGVSGWVSSKGGGGMKLATLIAFGIGMHNLGEGLAIGSSYATGALALGTFLVVGFALHNTTEGLAIVAPISGMSVSLGRLLGLGLLAGAPAILGAWIGASAFNASLAAFLFGAGAGAIAQVIVQLAPSLRKDGEQGLSPRVVGGLLTGMAVMFATGLVI
ncbi:MAG TPA: ZIP family metal transporter [Solirubrobacteraceae bacterium]